MSDKFAGWRKSTHSGDGNSCVEVAAQPQSGHVTPAIGVRDSKRNGRGPVLEFTASAWREFLSQIKSVLSLPHAVPAERASAEARSDL